MSLRLVRRNMAWRQCGRHRPFLPNYFHNRAPCLLSVAAAVGVAPFCLAYLVRCLELRMVRQSIGGTVTVHHAWAEPTCLQSDPQNLAQSAGRQTRPSATGNSLAQSALTRWPLPADQPLHHHLGQPSAVHAQAHVNVRRPPGHCIPVHHRLPARQRAAGIHCHR